MPFPVVPAAVVAGVAALLLLMRGKASTPVTPPEPPLPPPPPPEPGPQPFVRPKRPPNPPAGAGWATIQPACGPNDAVDCRYGILVHSTPDTSVASRVGPKDSSATSPHAVTGDEVALIADGIPDQSSPPTNRLWAQVMTPMGNVGYISSVDTEGRSNLTNVSPPGGGGGPQADRGGREQPVVTAGGFGGRYGQPRFAPHYASRTRGPRYVRCVAPSGCWLRIPGAHPNAPRLAVEHGAMLVLLSTAPGAALVRYHDRTRNAYVDGWVPSAWLAG